MILAEEFEAIDSHIRVSTSIDGVLSTVDKEFSLCANYPKGHGELFCDCIEKNQPGVLLLHVEQSSGSRQDLSVEGAKCFFLDWRLWNTGDNIF